LLLTLDLYLEAGQLGPNDPRAIEVSKVLNGLGIHTDPPDGRKFRNVNGVCLKLANFRSIDPSDPAEGMSRGGKLDEKVFFEFVGDRARLRTIALAIREAQSAGGVTQPEEGEEDVQEGRLLYRLHRIRERDPRLARKKKRQVLEREGHLRCEVCAFDFADVYGKHGEGYIEAHHRTALSISGPRSVRLADLALVCANCHRMLHRGKPWPTVEDLAQQLTATTN
jgi:5-methylcytosine-specific restriction protein A